MKDRKILSVVSCQLSVFGDQGQLTTGNEPNSESGFTLLELIITLTVIAILAAGTVPVVHNMVRRQKELELRRNLREIRQAIDTYQASCLKGEAGFDKETDDCYPPSLEAMVKGFNPPGKVNETKRFLRRVPLDPFTQNTEWGMRSMEDDPFSTGGGPSGRNGIFDVYSTAQGKALDGSEYSKW
jgi:general secretion pathway protein G